MVPHLQIQSAIIKSIGWWGEYCLFAEHVQTMQFTTVCASAALGTAETVPGGPCIGDMQHHFQKGLEHPWI